MAAKTCRRKTGHRSGSKTCRRSCRSKTCRRVGRSRIHRGGSAFNQWDHF